MDGAAIYRTSHAKRIRIESVLTAPDERYGVLPAACCLRRDAVSRPLFRGRYSPPMPLCTSAKRKQTTRGRRVDDLIDAFVLCSLSVGPSFHPVRHPAFLLSTSTFHSNCLVLAG